MSERKHWTERPGTVIDHRFAEKIYGTVHGKKREIGLMSQPQDLFQCGGEFNSFVYWKERLVSIPLDVWEQIEGKVQRWELIDHDAEVCWVTDMDVAKREGKVYDAGIGRRFGVPLDHFRKEGKGNDPMALSLRPRNMTKEPEEDKGLTLF